MRNSTKFKSCYYSLKTKGELQRNGRNRSRRKSPWATDEMRAVAGEQRPHALKGAVERKEVGPPLTLPVAQEHDGLLGKNSRRCESNVMTVHQGHGCY